jgi:hypothetical protein
VNFTWNAVSFIDNKLFIKLNFTFPSEISPLMTQDDLIWNLKGDYEHLFISTPLNKPLEKDFKTIATKIMPQIKDNALSQTAFTVASSSKVTMKICLLVAFLLNQVLSGSYSYMIAMIRCLQMVLHIPLMNIVVPGNITMVFGFIIPIVMFDVLENDDYNYSTVFQFDEETNVAGQV